MTRSILLAIPLLCLACSEVATHRIGITGSTRTQAGIDAAEAQGWTVSFEKVHVVLVHPGLIEEGGRGDEAWVRRQGVRVFDVVTPEIEEGSHTVYEGGLRASTYDGFDFTIAPPSSSGYSPEAGNVESADVDALVEADASIRVVGSATDGTETKTFDWNLATDFRLRCDVLLVLEADGEGSSVIEVSAEKLFADNLVGAPGYGFAVVAAADGNGDGAITLEELDAVPIADTGYDPGERDIASLGDWVRFASRSIASTFGMTSCEYIDPR